jgi:hypothetical protein
MKKNTNYICKHLIVCIIFNLFVSNTKSVHKVKNKTIEMINNKQKTI